MFRIREAIMSCIAFCALYRFFEIMRREILFVSGIILLLFSVKQILAQNTTERKLQEIHQKLKKIYGTSAILANGTHYLESYAHIEGYPYLSNNAWMEATLFLKGNTFDNIRIKYDIFDEKLILLSESQNGYFRTIYLEDQIVDSFYLKNRSFSRSKFINRKIKNLENVQQKYLERIYDGHIKLYIGYYKTIISRKNDLYSAIGEFSPPKKNYFLLKNGQAHEIKRRKDIIDVFPDKKKHIKRFMRKNKIKIRKATSPDFNNLMTYLDELV